MRSPRSGSTTLVAFAALVCLACGGGDADPITPQPEPPTDSTPTGDIQLVRLSVTVSVDPDDAAVGEELGWADGAVEQALVTVRRVGSQREDSAQSDANGRAVFEDLLEGDYTVSAVRLLGEAERRLLSETNADVSVFGGGVRTRLAPTSEGRTVSMTAGRRGSILISEYSFNGIWPAGGNSYSFDGFLEHTTTRTRPSTSTG